MNRTIRPDAGRLPSNPGLSTGRVAFALSAKDIAAIVAQLGASKHVVCLLLIDSNPNQSVTGGPGVAGATEECRAAVPGLSERQHAVLQLIATGATTREMAISLVLSERTVERHIANLYARIGARNRAEATAYAAKQGLI
jgi:DNA-binding NarL/FixJ family response regulator